MEDHRDSIGDEIEPAEQPDERRLLRRDPSGLVAKEEAQLRLLGEVKRLVEEKENLESYVRCRTLLQQEKVCLDPTSTDMSLTKSQNNNAFTLFRALPMELQLRVSLTISEQKCPIPACLMSSLLSTHCPTLRETMKELLTFP